MERYDQVRSRADRRERKRMREITDGTTLEGAAERLAGPIWNRVESDDAATTGGKKGNELVVGRWRSKARPRIDPSRTLARQPRCEVTCKIGGAGAEMKRADVGGTARKVEQGGRADEDRMHVLRRCGTRARERGVRRRTSGKWMRWRGVGDPKEQLLSSLSLVSGVLGACR